MQFEIQIALHVWWSWLGDGSSTNLGLRGSQVQFEIQIALHVRGSWLGDGSSTNFGLYGVGSAI